MPFFPQAYLSPQAGLFQILSELDTASSQQQSKPQCARRCRPTTTNSSCQTFTPRFDVTEVSQAYELFGDVPGLEQDDLSIEFSDAQTLVIKGKTARGVPTSTHTPAADDSPAQPEHTDSSSSDEKSHNPTVEDEEYDEADAPLATPASTTTATAAAETPNAEEQKQDDTPKHKYWVAERRVGTFARSFSFSQVIEQDAVQASLKNGVLHIVVPKSQKSRKVAVSVN